MQNETRKYTPEYKTKLVLETFKSGKSVRSVALKNDLSPSVLSQWKKEFISKAPTIFENRKIARHSTQDKPFVTDAYMKIIRRLRENKDMTQEQVAKYLGTSQTMYARYENGMSKMPIRHLMMLVKLYDVSADYILGIDDDGTADDNCGYEKQTHPAP
jgi:transposase-like protein